MWILRHEPLADALPDAGGVQPGHGQTLVTRTVLDECVGYADVQNRQRKAGFGQQFGNG